MKRILPALLALLALALPAAAATLDASLFGKSVEIAVGSGKYSGGPLANFPLLVRLDRASGFSFGDFASPADELRFADANGDSLDFEIDTWDSALGALVWVSVPSFSASTAVTAYYAPKSGASLPAVSSSAVWTKAGYAGVWHCGSFASGGDDLPNSADPALVGTTPATGYPVIESADAVVGAHASNKSDGAGGIYVPASTLALGGKFTVSGWFKCHNAALGDYPRLFAMHGCSGFSWNTPVNFAVKSGKFFYCVKGANVEANWGSAGDWTDARVWRHLTMVQDGTTFTAYSQGASFVVKTGVTAPSDPTEGFSFARRMNGTATPWLGSFDEVRFRCGTDAGADSADWAAADYATQADAAFLDYGAVIAIGAAISGGDAAASSVTWTTASLATTFTVSSTFSGTAAVTLALTPAGGTPTSRSAGTVSSASGAVSLAIDDLLPGTSYTAQFAATYDDVTVYSGTASFTTEALPAPTVSGIGERSATASATFALVGAGYTGVEAVFSDGTRVAASGLANPSATVSTLEKDTDYTVRFELARSDGLTVASPAAAFTTTGVIELDASAFQSHRTMTATGYDGSSTLSFFPVLVRIPATIAETIADAAEIRFSDASGTLLAHEIDTWNPTGESLVWVSLRSLSGTDTSFTMHWNPVSGAAVPSARPATYVWTRAGYVAVYHMADATWADSSGVSGAPIASDVNAPAVYSTPGPLGASYKGKQNYSSLLVPGSSTARWNLSEGITLETWVNASQAESSWRRVFAAGTSWTHGCETFGTYASAGGGNNGYYMGRGKDLSSNYKWPASVQGGGWGHMSFVYDGLTQGSSARAYADGAQSASVTVASDISYAVYGMGLVSRVDAAEGFLGALDEMRVRAKASTADWTQATWDTAVSGSTFLSYGEVVETSAPSTMILVY